MMGNEEERRLILEMIDGGKITAEQGLRLLQSLPAEDQEEYEAQLEPGLPDSYQVSSLDSLSTSFEVNPDEPSSAEDQAGREESEWNSTQGHSMAGEQGATPPDFNRWRQFWVIPFWIGVAVTILGSLLMFLAQQATGMSFWFFCAGIPFTLGIVLMVLAWQSRSARWLHLRVQQSSGEWPRKFAVSFPLPLRASSWFMRTFRHRIPGMEDTSINIDEVIAALEHSTSPDNPLYLEVEEDDGERVQIFIG